MRPAPGPADRVPAAAGDRAHARNQGGFRRRSTWYATRDPARLSSSEPGLFASDNEYTAWAGATTSGYPSSRTVNAENLATLLAAALNGEDPKTLTDLQTPDHD
jgi:hypothetical protein